MKILLFTIFILISSCVYSSENIYEITLSHFIDGINEGVTLNYTDYKKDSILLFERNDIFDENKIPDTINGYRIVKLESVKDFIDTCSKSRVTIFIIDKMDYCQTCDAPFFLTIKEYTLFKIDSNFSFCNWALYPIHYTYDSKKRKFKYKNLGAYGCLSLPFDKIIKRGWADKK